MKDNNAHVDLLIAACKKIIEFTQPFDKQAFLLRSIVQSAVIMQLQVIGETAKKLDQATLTAIEAPWKMIIGLRNVIAHNYFMLDLESIWNVATHDVPDLEAKLHAYLASKGTSYLPPWSDTSSLFE